MTLNSLSNWKKFLSMLSVGYVLDTQPEMLSKQSDMRPRSSGKWRIVIIFSRKEEMDPDGRTTLDLGGETIFYQHENGGYRYILLGAERRERHRMVRGHACLMASVK